jgi:hypothetical protein
MLINFEIFICIIKSLHASDLLLKWKEIINTFIIYDYIIKLHQKLNSWINYENSVNNNITYQHYEYFSRGLILSNELQLIANNININRLSNELIISDENVWIESLNESKSINDIYNKIIVLFYFIIKTADLL